MTGLVCLLFFLSGMVALLFETLWFRQAGLAFGAGPWASSLVLTSFMAGIAGGNAVVLRFGHRLRRPLRAYAGLEFALGLGGFALVLGFPHLNDAIAPLLAGLEGHPVAMNGLRFVIAFALLLVPTAAMGATLPILLGGLAPDGASPGYGRSLGLLYGANTLGAVVGALAGELALIGALGVRGTGAFAAITSGGIAIAAMVMARRLEAHAAADGASGAKRSPMAPPAARRPSGRAARLLAATFLAGATLLALEVVWFRLLATWTLGTALAFAIMLAVVLAGIGIGGLLAAVGLSERDLAPWLPVLGLASATLLLVSYGLTVTETRGTAELWRIGRLVSDAVALMLPCAILSGVFFPAIGQSLARELGGATAATAGLVVANTAGGALGALVGGLVLLPTLGGDLAILVLGGIQVVMAGLCMPVAWTGTPRRIAIGTLALFLGLAALLPHDVMETRVLPEAARRYQRDGSSIREVRQGRTESIVYLERRIFGLPYRHRLVTNGYSMSASTEAGLRYMRLFAYLPALLHPRLEDALLISFGIGTTAEALTDIDSVRRIDVVDISRDVLEMNRIVHPDRATAPLSDARIRVHVEDGRQFLQRTERHYDLITGEPPPPLMAGVVNLYSREYFELAHQRLRPGGMMSYWLPMHSLEESESRGIIRAFCEVFPECSLWLGAGLDWMLLGYRDSIAPVAPERLAARFADPRLGGGLRAVGVETPRQIGALFIADAPALRELTRNSQAIVDDFPHRIAPIPARGGESRYFDLLDPVAARERFAGSAWIRDLFDAATRADMDQGFRWRRVIHDVLSPPGARAPDHDRFAALDEALRESDLETLPLWLLGSDPRVQEILASTSPGESERAHASLHRGHGALATREHAVAARHYADAAEGALPAATPTLLRAYALCLDGRIEEGREVVTRLDAGEHRSSPPDRGLRAIVERSCAASG